MQNQTITVVLAGGVGRRLAPLTEHRAKPAVPFGGKYRIIDFPLANCLHSGLRQILVLTQYKSHSLQKHLRDGWSVFNPELGEYITTIPPQMRLGDRWYQGTADAIYQNKYLLERSGAERVLVLSADHIYRMDYAAMLAAHARSGAKVSIAAMEVPAAESGAFGVLEVGSDGRVTGFREKPAAPDEGGGQALVSMGIYVFDLPELMALLEQDHADPRSNHDFGRDVLPKIVADHPVYAYRFGSDEGRVTPDRYWRDVGTLDAYYQANMDLLETQPPLDLYQPDWPIRSHQLQTPPARTVPGASGSEGIFINSIVAGGVVIAGGSVQSSVLFPQVQVGDEAFVEESILFNGVHVGDGARLRRCIVEKHVAIPPGESIGHDAERDRARFTITEGGIVVIPRDYCFNET